MIVSVIFGRGGSKGIESKNTLPLLGRPVMAYPLLACRHARRVERMFVSTDDDDIARIAAEAGCELIDRPAALCSDDAQLQDAIRHAYLEVGRRHGKPEYLVITLCNSPNILAGTIDEAIEMLDASPGFDSVITVGRFQMFAPERARTPDHAGRLQPYVPLQHLPHDISVDRHKHQTTYFADQGAVVVRAGCLEDLSANLPPFPWMGRNIGYIEQLPGGADIDDPWQIPALEWWLREHGFGHERTPYDD